MAIKYKMTAALLMFAVIGAVLITNFSEYTNYRKINTAITSLYEDRLIVEGYIFELSQHLDALNNIYSVAASSEKLNSKQQITLKSHLAAIEDLNLHYGKTKLTAEEKQNFERFREICASLAGNLSAYNNHVLQVQKAEGLLRELSAIQMKEARLQMDSVTSLSSFSSVISQFEMAILIVIAVMIQALVWSSKVGKSLTAQKSMSLN